MSAPHPRRSRGFTLVEILVVVAIIVIVMAILIPTAMGMISRARNTAIAVEIGQIKTGLDKYKEIHGDYPPSMGGPATQWLPANRSFTACERHLLRCYPKMTGAQKVFFYDYIAPQLDNAESLVFWLGLIANDPREPFKNFVVDNSGNLYFAPQPGATAPPYGVYPGPYTRHVHFEFDERRLQYADADVLPGYTALYCRDTPYVYLESRTYRLHMRPNTAALGVCQPFNDAAKVQASLSSSVNPDSTFVNQNTFQIHVAGQDGNFGVVVPTPAVDANFNWVTGWQRYVKTFPNMLNTNEEDSDNIADFTEGQKLVDHRP